MALFYQVQCKAGYQPFVISTYIQLQTAVDLKLLVTINNF